MLARKCLYKLSLKDLNLVIPWSAGKMQQLNEMQFSLLVDDDNNSIFQFGLCVFFENSLGRGREAYVAFFLYLQSPLLSIFISKSSVFHSKKENLM